jgi:hypothetical protein
MENKWNTIGTAPLDGTIVALVNENKPEKQPVVMFWNGQFWEGLAFTPTGSRRTIWDPQESQPTHWREIE